MKTRVLSLLAAVCMAGASRAEVVTLGVSDTYSPGSPFTVNVGLAPVNGLGLYNVELVFRSSGASGGWLTIDPLTPSTSGYVFPSADNFLGSTIVVGNEYRLTLSDFTLDPVGPDVTAGVNDRITALTVRPISGLNSPIEVSIDRSSLFVDDAIGNSLLTDGILPSVSISPNTPDPNPVPAPAGGVLVAIGLGLIAARRCFRSGPRTDEPAK